MSPPPWSELWVFHCLIPAIHGTQGAIYLAQSLLSSVNYQTMQALNQPLLPSSVIIQTNWIKVMLQLRSNPSFQLSNNFTYHLLLWCPTEIWFGGERGLLPSQMSTEHSFGVKLFINISFYLYKVEANYPMRFLQCKTALEFPVYSLQTHKICHDINM